MTGPVHTPPTTIVEVKPCLLAWVFGATSTYRVYVNTGWPALLPRVYACTTATLQDAQGLAQLAAEGLGARARAGADAEEDA